MKLRESARGRIRCGDVGEDRLIAQLVAHLKARPDLIAGPGDDCAVVAGPEAGEWLLLKTDCVVERIHFRPNEKPAAVGWKAMARVLSDFAAMSGRPRFALVTLVVAAKREASWVRGVYRGLERAAERFEVAIVGGETSASKGPAMISVAATGSVEKDRWVSRAGGQAGDALLVTGKLGGSIRQKHLNFIPRIEEARWLTANFEIHAMMDLSDGLGADLPRLAKASGLGFAVEEAALPRNRGCSVEEAINDGEDYELLFALSPQDVASLQAKWRRKFPRLPLSPIGRLTRHSEFIRRGGLVSRHSFHGFVHFQ